MVAPHVGAGRWKAYHLLGAAVGGAPRDGDTLFTGSLSGCVNGFIDHQTYLRRVGDAVHRAEPLQQVERDLAELMRADCNPLAELFRSAPDARALELRWNGFNRTAPLGVETVVTGALRTRTLRAERSVDAHAAWRAQLSAACFATLVRCSPEHAVPRRIAVQYRELCGTRGSVPELLECVYDFPQATLAQCAHALHTARRTLQRDLTRHGLTFRLLRQAVRITLAGELMRTRDDSLTVIAHSAGFFDSAHLTHAWQRACALSPSQYRGLHRL